MNKLQPLAQIVEAINRCEVSEEQLFDLYRYGSNTLIKSSLTRSQLAKEISVEIGDPNGQHVNRVMIHRLIETTTKAKLSPKGTSITGGHSLGYFVRPSDQNIPLPPLDPNYKPRKKVGFNKRIFDLYINNKLELQKVTKSQILSCDRVKELGITQKNWSTLRETTNPDYRFRYKYAHLVNSDDPNAVRERTPKYKNRR